MTTIGNSVNTTITTTSQIAETQQSTEAAKSQLQKLFVQEGTINEGSDGAARLEKQIQILEDKITALEEQAKKIYDEIAEKEGTIDDKSGDLAELAGKLTNAQGKCYDITVRAAKSAAATTVNAFKNGQATGDFGDEYAMEFAQALSKFGGDTYKNIIANVYKEFQELQGSFKPIYSEIQSAIGEVNGLQSQVKNINATKTLLTRTATMMKDSTVEDAYQNCDTDSSIPMFSGQKADFANSLLAQYQSRNDKTAAEGTKTGGSQAAIDAAKTKWTPAADAEKYTTGDIYNAQVNPELMALREAVKGGMLDELASAGMSADDIMQYVKDNWNVGLSKNDKTGAWKIPNGHDKECWCKDPAYTALAELCTKGASANVTADSANQNQVTEMNTAIMGTKGDGSDGILTQMYEHGFSFKEAMYTLTKLFPDAGITYDPTKGERGYEMVSDSDSTGNLYKTIGDQVKNYWNVDHTQKVTDPEPTPKPERTDPVTFQDGNKTYTFIIDRNKDGKFDYTDGKNNELLGSEGGIDEILKYAGDDGILSAEEMEEHGIMLMVNEQSEDYSDKDSVKKNVDGKNYTNSVDFNVSYTTAKELGIASLDLSGAAGKGTNGAGDVIGDSTRTYDGAQEEYDDINGSSVINTFKINKTSDSKLSDNVTEAKETLNTEANLNTFYGKIANDAGASKTTIKLTDDDVNKAVSEAEGSDVIDGYLEKLNTLADKHKDDPTSIGDEYKDLFTYDATKDPFSDAHIKKIREAAAKAAEDSQPDSMKAMDEAGKAVEKYYDEQKWGKEDKD